ncbi:MAG: hypothetical protein M3171_05740 [Actinomycetota bacterium]|nr:hypothetical protein [Actinomycetota bacterium]
MFRQSRPRDRRRRHQPLPPDAGQEDGSANRPEFFVKDEITWRDDPPAPGGVDVLTGTDVDLGESIFLPGWGYVVVAG